MDFASETICGSTSTPTPINLVKPYGFIKDNIEVRAPTN